MVEKTVAHPARVRRGGPPALLVCAKAASPPEDPSVGIDRDVDPLIERDLGGQADGAG